MPFSIAWCTLGLLLRNTVIWNNNYRCWKYCSNIAGFPGSWVDWIGKKCYKIYHTLHLFSYDKTTMKECTAVYTCYFIIPTPLTFPHSLKLWHLTELLLYYSTLFWSLWVCLRWPLHWGSWAALLPSDGMSTWDTQHMRIGAWGFQYRWCFQSFLLMVEEACIPETRCHRKTKKVKFDCITRDRVIQLIQLKCSVLHLSILGNSDKWPCIL